MPTATFDLITFQTLGTAASSVTLNSIPSTYRDLFLVCNVIHQSTTANYDNVYIKPNNTSTNVSYVNMLGTGTSTASYAGNDVRIDVGGVGLTETWTLYTAQFFDYAQTNKHKTYLIRGNNPNSSTLPGTMAHAARWASTTAISSLVISATANFRAGSTFALYGIVS